MTAMASQPDSAALVAMLARSSPDRFMHWLTEGKFRRPRHIRHMGDVMQAIAQGNARIILQVTVRHGKSWLGSWALPTWFLDRYPERSVGMATYQANFSARWGRLVRNTIMRHQASRRVRVADDSAAADSWGTTAGGGMHTAGVGGEFTGRGFDLLIIDDPIKNMEEAQSETYREKTWDWYTTTARTRLEPGASVVVIMARWHEDDLVGRLIASAKEDGEQWQVVTIPAIAEDDDYLGRAPGEPLWPERYDAAALDAIRRTVGSYAWSSLYQQRPSPAEGGTFKRAWIQRYVLEHDTAGKVAAYVVDGQRIPVGETWRFGTADLAATVKTTSDFSVLSSWVVARGYLLWDDCWHKRVEAPEQETAMIEAYRRGLKYIGIEKNCYSLAVIQKLVRLGVPIRELIADKDKVARAMLAAVWMEQGKIRFPSSASWLDAAESEILVFPNGKHDDIVDTLAYAALQARESRMFGAEITVSFADV